MSPKSEQPVAEEIERIKNKLEQSHDTDPFYMPPLLRELRNFIFQVHADYERSLEIIIKKEYLSQDKPFEFYMPLFSELTFSGKLKLAKRFVANFPRTVAENINSLRNDFAHKNGAELRNEYNDRKRLHIYKKLEEAHDKLNSFWESS